MSQTVLVTGASSGVGLAATQCLLNLPEKHSLIVCCNTNDAPLKALQKEHPDRDICIIKGDVSEPTFLKTTFRQSLHHFQIQRIDAAILNHGTLGRCPRIADAEVTEWEDVFRVNVFSYVGITRELIPYLRATHGRNILTSSGAATSGYTSWGAYGASKAAINHLALTLAKEEPDITTIAVRPGMVAGRMQDDIRTTFSKNMDENDARKFIGAHEDGKLLKPEQPGNVIARLAVGAKKDLSGAFVQWNDDELKDYQG